MTMGTSDREQQQAMWLATNTLPTSPEHPNLERLSTPLPGIVEGRGPLWSHSGRYEEQGLRQSWSRLPISARLA